MNNETCKPYGTTPGPAVTEMAMRIIMGQQTETEAYREFASMGRSAQRAWLKANGLRAGATDLEATTAFLFELRRQVAMLEM